MASSSNSNEKLYLCTFLLVVFTLSNDCDKVWIEVLVQDTAIFEHNALRVNMLCPIT